MPITVRGGQEGFLHLVSADPAPYSTTRYPVRIRTLDQRELKPLVTLVEKNAGAGGVFTNPDCGFLVAEPLGSEQPVAVTFRRPSRVQNPDLDLCPTCDIQAMHVLDHRRHGCILAFKVRDRIRGEYRLIGWKLLESASFELDWSDLRFLRIHGASGPAVARSFDSIWVQVATDGEMLYSASPGKKTPLGLETPHRPAETTSYALLGLNSRIAVLSEMVPRESEDPPDRITYSIFDFASRKWREVRLEGRLTAPKSLRQVAGRVG